MRKIVYIPIPAFSTSQADTGSRSAYILIPPFNDQTKNALLWYQNPQEFVDILSEISNWCQRVKDRYEVAHSIRWANNIINAHSITTRWVIVACEVNENNLKYLGETQNTCYLCPSVDINLEDIESIHDFTIHADTTVRYDFSADQTTWFNP